MKKSISRFTHYFAAPSRILFVLSALAVSSASATTPPATSDEQSTPSPTKPRFSLTDELAEFGENSILQPTQPFTIVAGKDPNGWSFMIEPYAWALGMQGKVGVGGLPPANVDLSAKSILQNLDWGIFGKAEVRKGRWGLMGGGFFAQLSTSASPEDRIFSNGSMIIQQGVASLALAYRVIDDRRGFLDVYAGARYYYLGASLDTQVNNGVAQQIGSSATDRLASVVRAQATDAVEAKIGELRIAISSAAAEARSQVAATASVFDATVKADLATRLLADEERRLVANLVDGSRDRGSRIFRNVKREDRGRGRGGEDFGDRALRRVIPVVSDSYRDYVKSEIAAAVATAAVKAAEARGEVDASLIAAKSSADQKAADAKGQLSSDIADALDKKLSTNSQADEWWVDPIFGVRGQINFTRWLFLHVQGDVGGFDTGSHITWVVESSIGVNITRNVFTEVGYRYAYVDYTNGGFLYQVNAFGLFSGIGVNF